MSFFSKNELLKLGFKSLGENVLVSSKCSIYRPQEIILGNNVRIDDFSILSGKIIVGDYVHISAYCSLYGKNGIEMMDYSGLSPRTTVFSAMDDFSGEYLINPMVPDSLTNVTGGKVVFEKYTQIGVNSVIFPNVTVNEGAVAGAFSLVNNNLECWTINAGVPTKIIKQRSKDCLERLNKINDL